MPDSVYTKPQTADEIHRYISNQKLQALPEIILKSGWIAPASGKSFSDDGWTERYVNLDPNKRQWIAITYKSTTRTKRGQAHVNRVVKVEIIHFARQEFQGIKVARRLVFRKQ